MTITKKNLCQILKKNRFILHILQIFNGLSFGPFDFGISICYRLTHYLTCLSGIDWLTPNSSIKINTFAKKISLENFEELGVRTDFLKALEEMNIIIPTEIQRQVIPALLNTTTDLVGQAQTGTGKTAAFGLPLLHRIDPKLNAIQGLILSPTRELGQQIAKQLFKYTKYSDKIFVEAVYGGPKIEIQIAALSRTTHIVVATPGRLIDLVKRKAVDLRHVKTLILDEADEMMSMGFKDELNEILSQLSKVESKWLFSATMPTEIKQIINTHLSENAVKIELTGKNKVNKDIEHQYIMCDDLEKFNVLLRFLDKQGDGRGMIFCKTKSVAQTLTKQLIAKNISADAIHGDLLQKERDKAMRAFKNGSLKVIVATDLAARGIDVANLAYVIHYQMPDQIDYYTHRSGRTGRAGQKGISICLVNTFDLKKVKYLEQQLRISFNQV